MRCRQTIPSKWLIVRGGNDGSGLEAATRLQRGSGILLLGKVSAVDLRRLRQLARRRGLTLVREARGAAERVHNLRELRAALMRDTPVILLSPLYPTQSHPDWTPIPRMRAAALARLAGRRLVALGGMNDRRYAKDAPLGFVGWAGISAF